MGDEDFDYIAKVLFNHPTIQAVMGAQDIQKKRKLLKRFKKFMYDKIYQYCCFDWF